MPSGWPENDGVSLDPRHPRALGICDYCGRTWHLDELKDQWEFGGFGLINLHYRVGKCCLDKPQEQLKSIILPPDPVPALNPRIENYTLDNNLGVFTQCIIFPDAQLAATATDVAILSAVAQQTGVPTPAVHSTLRETIKGTNAFWFSVPRTWTVQYNYGGSQIEFVALPTGKVPVYGAYGNVQLGPGEALYAPVNPNIYLAGGTGWLLSPTQSNIVVFYV